MKIGVILRKVDDRFTLNSEIEKVVSNYNGVIVGITSFNEEIINFVDGFILQGGSDYSLEDLKIVEYLYKNNIPTLGICLGMQLMCLITGANFKKIENSNHFLPNEVFCHEVNIAKTSMFYEIIKKEKIKVNSRHCDSVDNTSLFISGVSDDGVIEVVEDKNNIFFIGVQWHPETNFEIDINSKKLFDYYFNILNNSHL